MFSGGARIRAVFFSMSATSGSYDDGVLVSDVGLGDGRVSFLEGGEDKCFHFYGRRHRVSTQHSGFDITIWWEKIVINGGFEFKLKM